MATSDQGKAAGVRAALEAFAGHTIDASTEEIEEQLRLTLVFPISSYSVTPNTPDAAGDNVGKVVSRNVILGGRTCALSELLDISSFSVVSDTGNATLRIKSLLCPDESRFFAPPTNIVATPFSATPIFATVTHSLIFDEFNRGTDIEIHIFAWDANGEPAPHVTVNWRCQVPVFTVIL